MTSLTANPIISIASNDLRDNRLGVVSGPSTVPAAWLPGVERRISQSIVPAGNEQDNDGRWLSRETASAARAFFQSLSDVLPGEPYVYSSRGGELVAEFKAKHGTMTSVVSKDFVVTLASVYGQEPVTLRLMFGGSGFAAMRKDLQPITDMLETGISGAGVDT